MAKINYIALYESGKEKPCGVITTKASRELVNNGRYSTRRISPDEAIRLTDEILRSYGFDDEKDHGDWMRSLNEQHKRIIKIGEDGDALLRKLEGELEGLERPIVEFEELEREMQNDNTEMALEREALRLQGRLK